MAIEFKLPPLDGEAVDATVTELKVSEGDIVEKDQPLAEVTAEKSQLTVYSPAAGKVVKLHIAEEEVVAVGQLVAEIEPTAGSDGQASNNGETQQAQTAEAAAQAAGDQTTQATTSSAVAAPPKPSNRLPVSEPPVTTSPHHEDWEALPAGPGARRLARKLGIDLHQVRGTGKRGRITPDDVLDYVSQSTALRPASAGLPAPLEDIGQPEKYGEVEVAKLSPVRAAIARKMTQSTTIIPHLTNFDDADVTELERIRKSIDPERVGGKLTSLVFIIKAVALALKERPMLNASIDVAHERVIYKNYINLGIAADTEAGLVVPVLRNVDQLTIPEIAVQLRDLAEKARSGKVGVADMKGGSFTISNMGAIGGQYSTPIINYPEVAILLLGRTQKRVVPLENGEIGVRQILPLSLSYDHRLVDGAEAARFLEIVKNYLQQPGELLVLS